MCTLTWWTGDDGGYEIFFNRDEMKSRPLASPPELSEKNRVRFLSPRDSAAGGTWMLVNEFGVTIALLNWYSQQTATGRIENKRSRGQLVLELGDVKDLDSLRQRLIAFDPEEFQPFRLLAFFPGNSDLDIDYWQWSGTGEFERTDHPPMPICSSSFDRETVIKTREVDLRKALSDGAGPGRLWNYHHNLGSPESSASTVRMNRPDAQTWSISRITVDPDKVRFLYEAEALDLAVDPEVFESSLERATVG